MTDTTFALVGIAFAVLAGQPRNRDVQVLCFLAALAFLVVAVLTTKGWI